MENRRYILVGVLTAALILVGSVFTFLNAQAGGNLLPVQLPNIGALPPEEDLSVTQVDILTATNTRLDFRFVAKNEGPTTISMISITYGTIVSTDTIYGNPGDKTTGGWSMISHISELEPGEAFTVTQTANPSNIDFFAYDYFMVRIDNNNQLEESDEDNNVDYAPIPRPDLIIPVIDVLSINNNSVVYQFKVLNNGDRVADLSNVLFQGLLSENDVLGDGDEVPAGGWIITPPSELLPGEVITKTYSVGMSGSNFLDYRYIFGIIDLTNALLEKDEDNNEAMGEIPHFIFLPAIQR